ncbi:MAG: hypothetical protein IJW67_07720 [Blautia sp.]|nr:hypothetical protein [Blautia sp.]
MKLKKNVNLMEFVQAVKTCGHDVFFETVEGDRLNLKSTLSEYIFAAAGTDQSFLDKGEIVCDEEADFKKIASFVEAAEA